MEKIVNLQAGEKPVDLTPAMAASWRLKDAAAPVLIVNPGASLHQRSALAWLMASETLTFLEASKNCNGMDPGNDRAALCAVIERMHQLETLLSDIGDRTAVLEGGAA